MKVCRICLSSAIHDKLSQIKSRADGCLKDGLEILMFCLNIRLVGDKHQICIKCYRKLLSFYKFKLLAIKNNNFYYEKIEGNVLTDNENNYMLIKDEVSIKVESEILRKDEPNIEAKKIENDVILSPEIRNLDDEFDNSDDDVLAVKRYNHRNSIRDTILPEEHKEIQSIPKKRGRPKIKHKIIPKKERQMCEECGKVVMNLKSHMFSHVSLLERKVMPCHLCHKVFRSYAARRRHIKTKHLGYRKHCDICNKAVINLQQHILTAHRTEELKHKCLLCCRRFHCGSKLEEHMRTHTNTRPYECDDCGMSFRIKPSLTSHIQIVHQKLKTHLCQVCSKAFYKESRLKQHLRTHTKEKPYPCGVCGKCFGTTGQKNVHEMRHTQIRNYVCGFCDMSFITSSDRTKHMVSHTKERRHQCSYCDDKFTRSDHKKRHERTAHEKLLVQHTQIQKYTLH